MTFSYHDIAVYVSNHWWNDNKQSNIVSPERLEKYVENFFTEFNLKYPGHNAIEDIAIRIYDEVMNKLKNKEKEEKEREKELEKELEKQRMVEMQIIYNRAKKETERRARTNVNKADTNKFRTKAMEGLSDEAVNELYNMYVSLWEEFHQQPKPKKPKEKPFKVKVDEYVILHPDELLNYEEFNNVSRNWNRNMTQQEAYKYYQDRFFALPGATAKIDEPDELTNLGFRNKSKYIFGTRDYEMNPKINKTITNYFPLKDNLKRYKLHKIAPYGTYMVDLMYCGKLVYLAGINVNTRYGMIELTNITNDEGEAIKKGARDTISYLRALDKMINEVKETNPIKHLTGDGEGAFKSKLSNSFYQQYGITFHPVPRMYVEGKETTDPLHSSLALVDRFIRTIRDMIFTAGYKLTPLAIKEMVRQYNNAPHSTLSKWIGFPVSPIMVQKDKNKEEYIVMKINKANVATKLKFGFDLSIGSRVKVFNEKATLGKRRQICREGVIVGRQGVLYRVKTNYGEELIPRYKLDLVV